MNPSGAASYIFQLGLLTVVAQGTLKARDTKSPTTIHNDTANLHSCGVYNSYEKQDIYEVSTEKRPGPF